MSTFTEETSDYKTPDNNTLQNASRLSIVEDKPIMLDYWNDSTENKALIGVKNIELGALNIRLCVSDVLSA